MFAFLKISQRIWLLTLLIMLIFAGTYIFETFQKRDDLQKTKQQQLSAVIDIAYSTIEGVYQRFLSGELNEAQAKAEAMQRVKLIRYSGQEYFWINDMVPKMIMHPIKPELDGKDLSNSQDPNGKFLFIEMVKVVKAQEQGFVDYYWPKPGSKLPVAKLSFVKGFKPWQWVIGSGVYLDDIEEEFSTEFTNHMMFLASVLALMLGLSVVIIRSILLPLGRTSSAMRDVAQGEGDLRVRIAVSGSDEMAKLSNDFNGFTEKVQLMVKKVTSYGNRLIGSVDEMKKVSEQSSQSFIIHQKETHQVATAVHQMSLTIQEVAKIAAEAASAVKAVQSKSQNVQQVVQQNIQAITALSGSIGVAASNVQSLENETQRIGTILDVIRSISDQTNLLALNAAIEAARAGEHGRGFAVVADEVRTLARRTQESTEEIQSMIEQLQSGAHSAVEVIQSGRQGAENSVVQAETIGEVLNDINLDFQQVTEMNNQIASATEQQSSTVETINHNVNNINNAVIESSKGAQSLTEAAEQLQQLSSELYSTLSQFKV